MAIVTISRGTFSGGKDVAEALAEKLGYPCMSREEIIKEAAEDFDIPEKDLSATMVEPPRFWQQVPSKRVAHLNFIRTTIIKHFEKGNLVFHGYAAHLLLGKELNILRVRINADKEYRISAAMRDNNWDRSEAIKMIERMDKQSTKWAKVLYGIEWRDPSLYDIVLNLQQISHQSAVETLAFMTSLDDFKMDEKSFKALENLSLGSRVWAALAKDKRTVSARINVQASAGKVTIKGSASSESVLNAITDVAGSQPGVTEIINEVGVGANWMW